MQMQEPKHNLNRATEATLRPLFSADLPQSIALASAADFQRDLSRYWRHVRAKGELGLTARGWIYKTAFRSLLAALNAPVDAPDSEQEQPRLIFMRQLLVGLKELIDAQTSLTINPAGRFFQMPLPARIRRSFETWRDANVGGDYPRAGDARPATTAGSRWDTPRRDGLATTIKARSAVLRAMARTEKTLAMEHSLGLGNLPPSGERWMSAATLVDSVARPDTAASGYAPDRAGLPDRPVVLAMLAGPLHWLGLLDLGYAEPNGATADPFLMPPIAYRLTETGLWLLDLASEPAYAESGGRVLVQPNFTILAMEPISDRVLMDLDQFADLQGGDRATSYQLTRQSVYRGQRAGWDVKRVVDFLEQHQAAPLPTNVRRSLDEWQALHHRIMFYRDACVIQFADAAARADVTRALEQEHLKPTSLGPMYTLVQSDRLETESGSTATQVISALSDAGWMPRISPASAGPEGRDDTEGCLRLTPSDDAPDSYDVQFKQPVPSLFALGQLAPLMASQGASGLAASSAISPAGQRVHPDRARSDPADNLDPSLDPTLDLARVMRITAAGIRGALSNGISLDEILATLAHLHDGPLPVQVEQSIRAWARFFGRAKVNTVCLFEFSDQEVLNNLLDDESVSHYLSPIDGSLQSLVAVDPAHAEAVRELLAERGIDVTG